MVVHGDASGTENLRRMLSDWLCDIGMIPAGRKALLDAYVGYYRPYATSHEDLDADTDFQKEVEAMRRARWSKPSSCAAAASSRSLMRICAPCGRSSNRNAMASHEAHAGNHRCRVCAPAD